MRVSSQNHGSQGRWRARILVVWVVLALLLGGGGSPNPWAELALQLATVALFAALLACSRGVTLQARPRSLLLIAVLALALPVVHLIPLPPSIWHALPGRELEHAALALVGQQESWRVLSIAPHRTLASLLAMLPPLALGLVVAAQPLAGRRTVLAAVAAMALASAVLGAAQMAGPGDAFRLYPDAHPGWLTGFQANRNAAADVLLIGAIAAMAWFASRPGRPLAPRGGAALAAVLGVLLAALMFTGSRAGIALLLVVVPAMVMMHADGRGTGTHRLVGAIGLAALLTFAAAALLALFDQRLAYVATRFGMIEDYRLGLWRDGWTAMLAYWPFGAGIGTFVPAFIPYESLASVDPTIPNRAHNDLLELAIEAGLPGLTVLAGIVALLLHLWARALRDPEYPRALAIFGLQTFILIGLHSLVDYPLRNMAVASLAGIALGMLAPLREATEAAGGAQGMGSARE